MTIRLNSEVINFVINVASRALSFAWILIVIKSYNQEYDAQDFGMFLTYVSAIGILSLLDFGLGNSLVTHVAKMKAGANSKLLSEYINNVCIISLLWSICIFLVLLLVLYIIACYGYIPPSFKNGILYYQLNNATLVVMPLIIFSALIQRIFVGIDKFHVTNICSIVCTILSILLLFILKPVDLDKLLVFFALPTIAPGLLLLLTGDVRNCLSRPFYWNSVYRDFKALTSTGGFFLVLQLGMLIGWTSDALIISAVLGPEFIINYTVIQKLYQLITQPVGIYNLPYWANFARAHQIGDYLYIKSTLLRNILLVLIFSSFMSLAICTSLSEILGHLGLQGKNTPYFLAVAFSIWAIIESLGNTFAMFLNGTMIIRPQVICVALLCIVGLPVKIAVLVNFGIPQMILSFAMIYIIIFGVGYGYIYKESITRNLSGCV